MLNGAEDGVEGDDRHDDDGALPLPETAEISAAMIRIITSKSLNCSRNTTSGPFLLSLCQRILSISGALLLNLLGGQALSGYAKLVQNLLGGTAKHLFHLF